MNVVYFKMFFIHDLKQTQWSTVQNDKQAPGLVNGQVSVINTV